jgi:iron complex outermembrane recepter protein
LPRIIARCAQLWPASLILIASPALGDQGPVASLVEVSIVPIESSDRGQSPAQSSSSSVTRSAPGARDEGRLEEIIVNSQRRPEDLQSVPLTLTAATAGDLLNQGVTDTASLSLAVPGLSYTLGGNAATPFIRGVGTTIDSVGNEASVATYVDGVYISSTNAALFELYDIDHVEVLKGPQGTLFGRNATGGVIQIITKDPSIVPSLETHIGYGNYDTSTGSLYATTGFCRSVAVDLAAYGIDQGAGWGSDLATGQPTFKRHESGGRSKLLWIPSDGTRITIVADENRAGNEDGLGLHVVPPGTGIDGVTRFNGFYNNYDLPGDFTDVRQTGLSGTLQQDAGVARLVTITSWRNVNGRVHLDQDATPSEVVTANYSQHDKSVTEELHILSREDATMPWIAGLYYFDDTSAYDPLGLMGEATEPLDAIQTRSAQKTSSYAAFGQITKQFLTDNHLTLGARYTKDERSVSGSTLGFVGAETELLSAASQSTSWSKPTWRVALDHRFTPEIMGYISDDRGFKSGVYNVISYATAPVSPETLDAYQFGVKSELAGQRVRLNAAVFYYNYSNIQVQEISAGTINLVNAAAAKMKGVDVDFAFLPVDSFTVRGGFELMNGRYTDFRNAPFLTPTVSLIGSAVGGNTQSIGDATGFDTVRTPKGMANISGTYRWPVSRGNFNSVLSYYYNSGFAWDPDNRLRQSSYDVLNASVDWSAASNAWGVRLWGRNLTGTRYCVYETEQTLLDSCSPAPPRTYGVTLSAHY